MISLESPYSKRSVSIFLIATLFVLAAVIAMRLAAIPLPLERDEGEFALMGQLILDGVPPFQEAFGQKLPGIYAAYAVIMGIFGQSCNGIHIGLLLINVLTVILLFLIAREILDSVAASIAASSYALLSAHQSVLGLAAHATHFVVLFAMAGLAVLLQAFKRGTLSLYFTGGMLFGVAFLMKQPGFFFGAFGALLLLWARGEPLHSSPSIRKFAMYVAGFASPYVFVCIALYAAGVFGQFWFWTYQYAMAYAAALDFNAGRQLLKYSFGQISGHYFLLWICAGAGIVLIFLVRAHRKHWLFFELSLIFSFAALSVGFYYRRHYFILLLPVASLLTGVTFSYLYKILAKITGRHKASAWIMAGLFIAFSAQSFGQQYSQIRSSASDRFSRSVYGSNPFPESVRIAEFISTETSVSDRIAVLGSEPQIYFYAKRRPATPYIYMYPMMEPHGFAGEMQMKMAKQIELRAPEYIVYVDIPESWLVQPDSEMFIFDWAVRYLEENYEKISAFEIEVDGSSRYFSKSELQGRELQAGKTLELFKLRK